MSGQSRSIAPVTLRLFALSVLQLVTSSRLGISDEIRSRIIFTYKLFCDINKSIHIIGEQRLMMRPALLHQFIKNFIIKN